MMQHFYTAWKRHCDETSMDGFKEVFYAKTIITKLIWSSIIVIGVVMTGYSVFTAIADYNENPTKTQITILAGKMPIKYPPLQFCYEHWVDWINLTKIVDLNFDLDTLLYATSFFNPLLTRLSFNVTKAKAKLKNIMLANNFTTMIDVAFNLALDSPGTVEIYSNFSRFMTPGVTSYLCYVTVNDEKKFNASYNLTFSSMQITSYLNFKDSQFNKNFISMFNVSLHNEFKFYRQFSNGEKSSNITLMKSLSLMVNPVGTAYNFGQIDVTLSDYEYYLKGTLYKWIPTEDYNCIVSETVNFYAECEIRCGVKYKVIKATPCHITFLPNISIGNIFLSNLNLTNVCIYDDFIVNQTARNKTLALWQQCANECSSHCNQWIYEVVPVTYPKVSPRKVDSVRGYLTVNYPDRNNIFVISLLPSYSWNDAIANIGGLLGLWLGGSIISFLQVIYTFILIPLESWVKTYRKRKIANETIIGRKLNNYNNGVPLNGVIVVPVAEELTLQPIALQHNAIEELYKCIQNLHTELQNIKQSIAKPFSTP